MHASVLLCKDGNETEVKKQEGSVCKGVGVSSSCSRNSKSVWRRRASVVVSSILTH